MYLTYRFYLCALLVVILLGMGQFFPILFRVGQGAMLLLVLAAVAEGVALYTRGHVVARRECADQFSNGDDNTVVLHVRNASPFDVRLTLIDEIPFVFQKRDLRLRAKVGAGENFECPYTLRPVERGDYAFGRIRVFATTAVGLLSRRYTSGEPFSVKVYPSFLMLKKYQLLSAHHLTEIGMKRIRRVGNNTEFEHIKDYVKGDDYRTINWKASARRHHLMVNVYQEERSQQVYSAIDKGRTMQQVFRGMTLLDYAINASLMISYVAVGKQDNVGLISFAEQFDTFLPASRQPVQMRTIMDSLYNQQTTFGETDYSVVCHRMGQLLSRRSFIMLYTNFTGIDALKRQMPYLRELNRRHRLLVIFFEDAELTDYAATPSSTTLEYYQHVVAEKYLYEKRLITAKLAQQGIHSLLTTPEKLTVDAVNKYLEMKARGLLS